MKTFLLLILALALNSCVMIDPKASKVTSAATSIDSFQGTFQNRASYRSSSLTGLHNQDLLQEFIGVQAYPNVASAVRLTVAGDRLKANIQYKDGREKERFYQLGHSCRFENGFLEFDRINDASGGNDSPSLGFIGSGRMRWAINTDGDLVIVSNNSVIGTVTILPVAMTSHWVAIFPRTR